MNKEELEMLGIFIKLGISESFSDDIKKYGYLEEKVFSYINQIEEENKKLKQEIKEITCIPQNEMGGSNE